MEGIKKYSWSAFGFEVDYLIGKGWNNNKKVMAVATLQFALFTSSSLDKFSFFEGQIYKQSWERSQRENLCLLIYNYKKQNGRYLFNGAKSMPYHRSKKSLIFAIPFIWDQKSLFERMLKDPKNDPLSVHSRAHFGWTFLPL